jgi:hypothetical protein
MESSEIEQRANMKFCFKLIKKPTKFLSWFMEMNRSSVDFNNRRKRVENQRNYSCKQKINDSRIISNLNISFASMQFVLTKNSNMRLVIAKLFHAFCHENRKNSDCRYRSSCLIMRIQIQFSYKVRSLETNLGRTFTIMKRKCRVITGKHRNRHEQRKRVNRNQMWKSCCSFSSILKELLEPSSCSEAPPRTRNNTKVC